MTQVQRSTWLQKLDAEFLSRNLGHSSTSSAGWSGAPEPCRGRCRRTAGARRAGRPWSAPDRRPAQLFQGRAPRRALPAPGLVTGRCWQFRPCGVRHGLSHSPLLRCRLQCHPECHYNPLRPKGMTFLILKSNIQVSAFGDSPFGWRAAKKARFRCARRNMPAEYLPPFGGN